MIKVNMERAKAVSLLITVTIALTWGLPTDVPSTRSTTSTIGDTIKTLSNQLIDLNATSDITLDVRTPPKFKQQQQMNQRNKFNPVIENSHAGVAIPIDEDSIHIEETTKKLNFYKIERPTTNSGLSTWILLSGQSSTTPKPMKIKTTIKPYFEIIRSSSTTEAVTTEKVTTKAPEKIKPAQKASYKPSAENETMKQNQNITVIVHETKPPRIVKPIIKKRTTTSKPTTTTTTPKEEKQNVSTTTPKISSKPTKLNKIKASILNNALNKKNNTNSNNKKQTTKTISVGNSTTESSVAVNTTDSAIMPIEAKDGDTDLVATTSASEKKKKSKKKKNKNRRRKPNENTKVDEEEPIGTQIYSYLSREIMPTVGVGLVGLVVTAGLASYFLFPFKPLRRNFIVDRKDNGGGYYYNDDHSGGILEEDAIGKVIAGMSNTYNTNAYKPTSLRNNYQSNNVRYRNVDRGADVQSSYTTSDIGSTNVISEPQNSISAVTYSRDPYGVGTVSKDTLDESTPVAVPEHGPRNLDTQPNVQVEATKRFVVGNIPKEFRDSGAVPRSLKFRRRRAVPEANDLDNEIDSGGVDKITTEEMFTTVSEKITTTTTPMGEETDDKKMSFMDVVRDLLHMKLRFGLEIAQNVTRSLSSYLSGVQMRLDEHYRSKSKENTS